MTQPEIDHPAHYNNSPSGIECITVVEHMNFNRGNAIKYIWRAGDKGDPVTDLQKARWYLDREIERLSRERTPVPVLDCACYAWTIVDARNADWWGRQHHPKCDGTGHHKAETT